MATPVLGLSVGSMEPFDSNTSQWSAYADRFEFFTIANGIKDDIKKAVFLTVVGAENYALICNLIAPATPNAKSFTELCIVMKNHFEPKTNVLAERFKFYSCIQKTEESATTFVANLRHLAVTCHFGNFLEEALRDRFVMGMHNEAIQRRLLSEENLTLHRAVELSQGMEAAESNSKTIHKAVLDGNAELHSVQRRPPSNPNRVNLNDNMCFRCNGTGHQPSNCRFLKAKCHKCGNTGHIRPACKTKTSRRTTNTVAEAAQNNESEEDDIMTITSVNAVKSVPAYMIEIEVNGKSTYFEIDTGATVSLVSEMVWTNLGSPKLSPCSLELRAYGNLPVNTLGECTVQVTYKGIIHDLPLVVTDACESRSLFGRNWLSMIQLDWKSVVAVHNCTKQLDLNRILNNHAEIFTDELGHCTKSKATLHLKDGAIPKFLKPRPVAYAKREKVEAALLRMESRGIITRISHSEWAAPIVPVSKSDGEIRVCGDFKTTLNPQLNVEQYPLPTPDDIFNSLNGGQKFTVIDLREAYLQMELDDQSKEVVVINTHLGLFRFNRMCFGIASAAAIFQKTMDQVCAGIPCTVPFQDDIIITGKNDQDHLENLNSVLQQIQEFGLRIKKEKCRFFQDSVEYLGRVIDANGIRPISRKIDEILNLKAPTSVPELRSFIGFIEYYSSFVPNMSYMTAPLTDLLRKGVRWNWSDECQDSFQKLKELLGSDLILTHFDPSKPLVLACDASAVGIGAILYHKLPDGTEKIIRCKSRTLTTAERAYSQIEREGLSIIYGVKIFHKYLSGHKFTLLTDHKPLVTIFGETKGIPTIVANRLQRWALILSTYSYTVAFRPTEKHANADVLSRLTTNIEKHKQHGNACETIVNVIQDSLVESCSPVTAEMVAEGTLNDGVLNEVLSYVHSGWPLSHKDLRSELIPYFRHSEELTMYRGCLLRGKQVVVPVRFRSSILDMLHDDGHLGIVRMKHLARNFVWWPTIDNDIDRKVKSCHTCAANARNPDRAAIQPWALPTKPWYRLHIDFAGPIKEKMYLIVVDATSKWPEVVSLNKATSTTTIAALRSIFARFGIPAELVSDNGPQFISEEFSKFCSHNGIRHIRVAPYHPSSNGEAERFVQTFKNSLKKGGLPGIFPFLLSYRTTEHSSTGKSPAELLMGRRLRTRLDCIKPRPKQKHTKPMYPIQKSGRSLNPVRQLNVGGKVWVRNYTRGKKFVLGEVVQKTGPVSYRVNVEGKIESRHLDQLFDHVESFDDFLTVPSPVPNPSTPSTPQPRRSTRARQPPNRFSPQT